MSVAVARFEATPQRHGKTATGTKVPAAALEALDRGRRPAVTATLNGYAYRTSVGSMGGRSLLPVSAEHRQGAGLSAGDVVQVELTPDDAPRTVQVPEDLAAALAAEPAAAAAFAAIIASLRGDDA